jgi:hypothetical protein
MTERAEPSSGRLGSLHPFHLVVVLVGLGGALITAGSLSDLDLYWHVRSGAEIWHRHTTEGIGTSWVYAVDARHWQTTQWLAEVVTYGLHTLGGYSLIRWATAALGAAVTVALLRAIVRPRAVIATSVLAAVVVLPMAPHLEDRPATISLLLLAALAPRLIRLARGVESVSLPLLLVTTLLWVQLHGYWVLLPAALLLAAVCRVLDRRLPLLEALRPANYATACVLVACLNPLGPSVLLTPFQFGQAHEFISEWKSTSLDDVVSWGLLGAVAFMVVAWARSSQVVERSEVLWFLAWCGFGLLAFRNVAVTLVLIAPLVADRVEAAFPDPVRPRSARERRGIAVAATVAAAIAVLAPVLRLSSSPDLPRSVPRHLLATLAATQPPPRVLNEYNLSGQILAFGGASQVAVDGRADLSAPLLPAYLDLIAARGDFEPLLARLHPNTALLHKKSAIIRYLEQHGWSEVGHEGDFLLLRAPSP